MSTRLGKRLKNLFWPNELRETYHRYIIANTEQFLLRYGGVRVVHIQVVMELDNARSYGEIPKLKLTAG